MTLKEILHFKEKYPTAAYLIATYPDYKNLLKPEQEKIIGLGMFIDRLEVYFNNETL